MAKASTSTVFIDTPFAAATAFAFATHFSSTLLTVT